MIGRERHGRRGRRLAVLAAVLLVLAGGTAITVALTSQVHAPQPAVSAGRGSAAGTTAPTAQATPSAPPDVAPVLPAAQPTHLDIAAIGVSSDLLDLGQNPDGTVQVPPLARDSQAGWYRYSPTPGERGPAVLLGHVDSVEYGPGVFFRLGALHPGDTVNVTRVDRTVATFRVTRVTSVPKDRFPSLDVYGNTDDAELRLITCGGSFDARARSYVDNIVVYAILTNAA